MSKKGNTAHRIFDERKRAFLQDFAKEAPQIRDDIVKDLPAYNKLLSLNAMSFEDFALQQHAIERKTSYDEDNPPTPTCPYCNQYKTVGPKGEGFYRCYSCNKSFTANYESISSGAKCDALKWMKVLMCLLDAFSIKKTCEYCDISITTYYKIRTRLFYAMQVLLQDLKLYGVIEVDNTFIRCSYKGANLYESEFEEDSIFFVPSFVPRASRQRGGASKKSEQNYNTVCIYTAIDEYGHVLTRFTGIGATNYQSLKHYIPKEKYLLSVPKTDPFANFVKKTSSTNSSFPGKPSKMVADKEKAIEKYANYIGIDFESHVYRRNGVQISLSKDCYNIQRVNALHRRLKDFLQKHHYVSTKYLPGYLVLFEFIENTGASSKAIGEIFNILSKPKFGKPSKYFNELYIMPNYLQEWLIGDNPLSKHPYNKIMSYYLYHQLKNKSDYPDFDMNLDDISNETGYTAPTIRKTYRDFKAAGYHNLIIEHFETLIPKASKVSKTRKPSPAPATINPIVLAIFDEYSDIRKLPKSQRPKLDDFIAEKNKQYGTNYKRPNLYAKFQYIVDNGIRPPLEELSVYPKYCGRSITKKHVEIYQEYENLVMSFREEGKVIPKRCELERILATKFSLSPQSINSGIKIVKGFIKNGGDIKDIV